MARVLRAYTPSTHGWTRPVGADANDAPRSTRHQLRAHDPVQPLVGVGAVPPLQIADMRTVVLLGRVGMECCRGFTQR